MRQSCKIININNYALLNIYCNGCTPAPRYGMAA